MATRKRNTSSTATGRESTRQRKEATLADLESVLPKDGKPRKWAKHPMDEELGEVEMDTDGNYSEKAPSPPSKKDKPKLPSLEEALKMDAKELEKIFKVHGVDPGNLADLERLSR